MKRTSLWLALCASLVLGSTPAPGAQQPPEVSPEGLHLQQSSKSRLVYVRPGASLSKFKRVAIIECQVEFEKDWQRDYNNSQVGLEGRVSEEDVERMKRDLAAEFKKVFTQELQDNGGYQVVNVVAPDVLVLRPLLLNVEVSAPDVMAPGVYATVIRSAGQMTLYLELWDSRKTLLAKVMDSQADDDRYTKPAGKVTNREAAEQILKRWAQELRQHLDAARSETPAS
jgi:hypothetical protein